MTTLAISRLSIRVQIAGLLVVTQLLAHLLTVGLVNLWIPNLQDREADFVSNMIAPLVTALRVSAPGSDGDADTIFAKLAKADPQFTLHTGAAVLPAANGELAEPKIAQIFNSSVPPAWRDRITLVSTGSFPWNWSNEPDLSVLLRLPGDLWVQFTAGPDQFMRAVPLIVLVPGILLLALPLMLLSIWAGSALVAPITSLVRGSERFAADIGSPPIPETGPEEVRRASRAFNAMRVRIQQLVNSRSQTLAAIGHDMRTPLTRLRLRIEALDLGASANAVEEDIRSLERMIDDALTFLRSEQRPPLLGPMDLAVLTQTVIDDFVDQGHRVSYDGPLHLPLVCDHDHMRRVLENIIGNATKYADGTLVRLTGEDDGTTTISVADSGPGIAPEHREYVLQPFSRIESVRAGGDSCGTSFGLGLAIARELVSRHGGVLKLGQNLPEGLLVTITLPASSGLINRAFAGEQSRNPQASDPLSEQNA